MAAVPSRNRASTKSKQAENNDKIHRIDDTFPVKYYPGLRRQIELGKQSHGKDIIPLHGLPKLDLDKGTKGNGGPAI